MTKVIAKSAKAHFHFLIQSWIMSSTSFGEPNANFSQKRMDIGHYRHGPICSIYILSRDRLLRHFSPIVWALGMVLFVFYIKHGRDRISNPITVQRFWVASVVFNGIGLGIPLFSIWTVLVTWLDTISKGYGRVFYSGDEWILAGLIALWSILIVVHFWLSLDSLRKVNAAIDQPPFMSAVRNLV